MATLEKAGIAWSDITPIPLAPADATAAFAQGAVDAWSIWDPYLALAELKGDARVLVFAKDIHQPNAFVIVRADFVEKYPAVVTRLNDVFASEGVWANAHHEEVAWAQAAASHSGPGDAGRLAQVTGFTSGVVAGVVDRMEKAGYVRRERHETTGARYLSVTPTAAARIGQLYASLQQALHSLWIGPAT